MLVAAQRQSLFVYGTLMSPQVIETLIGRFPGCVDACLAGYSRHPVRGQVFPGMVRVGADHSNRQQQSSVVTAGVLYQDLTVNEMKRLDWFEDVEYTRQCVTVVQTNPVDDDSSSRHLQQQQQDTETYVWTNPLDELNLKMEWSYQEFLDTHLENYLRDTVQPCRVELDRLGY